MSVKLTLLKSGETLISDVKEVVSDVNQDKPTAFLLENPHLDDTKKKGKGEKRKAPDVAGGISRAYGKTSFSVKEQKTFRDFLTLL